MDAVLVDGHSYQLSRAAAEDVPALVALLSDDRLGRTRESSDLTRYRQAFRKVDDDQNQLLLTVRAHGATLAQLTSDKTRTAAHRFYEKAGYTASHEGFKRPL